MCCKFSKEDQTIAYIGSIYHTLPLARLVQSTLAIFSSLTQELGEQLVSLSKGHNGKVRIGGERV